MGIGVISGPIKDTWEANGVRYNETTDPFLNAMRGQTVRSRGGQVGVTSEVGEFAYSCNDGYKFVGESADMSVKSSNFTCTGTGFGKAAWQGGAVLECEVGRVMQQLEELEAVDASEESQAAEEEDGGESEPGDDEREQVRQLVFLRA
uniref:Sushi domain-containing protein n=1 Tax=Chromera velia CCMP2878 TaxID=1169474 RepID=A0A0G4IAT9_9ALVE|eukprot:Cvel_12543.t1-p1 / transcript=Cvel_12543.t1 / gene=Cvel_12543 / organism=Chromera_velia_CCMP2878 / gene_product=hypothetical protein / transcript_product=hypothetical protein / location=Cvel_scaffold824:23105-26934(-) / protein_length=147 / sequence_SO=supercontig / SO=protein_coding / is_pseudo=false